MADVSSDATTIANFATKLVSNGMAGATNARTPMARVQQGTVQGFMTTPAHSQPFGEAALIVQKLDNGISDFTAFFADLQTGLLAMSNAATAIADIYATTDDTNGDDINAVNFAFADPTAVRPEGLSTDLVGDKSIEQYAAEQQAQAPDCTTMKPTDPGVIQVRDPSTNTVTYTFPDGSVMTAVSLTIANPNGVTVSAAASSYRDKNGQYIPASGSTDIQQTAADGSYTTTHITQQASNDPANPAPQTVADVTTVHQDGSSEYRRYVNGQQQGPTNTVAASSPTGAAGSDDPMAQAEQDYHSYGVNGTEPPIGNQYQNPHSHLYSN